MKKFGAYKIVSDKINECDFSSYAVGFDLNNSGEMEYRINALVKLLIKVVPEFAFGHHIGEEIALEDATNIVFESANAIYKIKEFQEAKEIYLDENGSIEDDVEDKYLKRGEFGELILHLLLRDFHDTTPLLSKIYFKDSDGHTVHGFDSVHICEADKTLWLGESKLYKCGKSGVDALIKDLEEHIETDYLNREFALISKKIDLLDNIPDKDHWLNIFDESTTLKDKFNSINIPLLCTYSSELYENYDNDSIEGFLEDYIDEVQKLKKRFDEKNKHPLKQHMNVILLLLPVKCKNNLVKKLHKKLHMMQEMSKDD
jgi:hypothetical protein